MPDNNFFYISTNVSWGGSEFLWYESAKKLHDSQNNIFVYVYKYQHPTIEQLKKELKPNQVFNSKRLPALKFYKRWINKIFKIYNQKDTLKVKLKAFKPDLVVISKGNAIGDEEIPLLVKELGFKYIILNHLVTESSWPVITPNSRNKLIEGIEGALKNFYVSKRNKLLFEKMIAKNISNSKVTFNPLLNISSTEIAYPTTENGFSVAIVGRLECFHKGIDIFFDVIKQDKWQKRPIKFNLYGEGPHKEIMLGWIDQYNIQNIEFHGYVTDKTEIWCENHILLLPSRMEGQSISLSEALMLKRTVIGTNVGGISEYIKDNETGFIAENANTKDLDNAMERAWIQREEWQIYGEKANHNWRNNTPKNPVSNFNQQLINLL